VVVELRGGGGGTEGVVVELRGVVVELRGVELRGWWN
jgi:hypothetical protein